MMRNEPPIEAILEISDPEVQRGLTEVADEMVAAVLSSVPEKVSLKILSNLSERRRAEIVLRQEKFPARTREVARKVILKAILKLPEEPENEEPEPESDRRKQLRQLMEKMAETPPDFIRAREEGRQGVLGEFFRRMLRP